MAPFALDASYVLDTAYLVVVLFAVLALTEAWRLAAFLALALAALAFGLATNFSLNLIGRDFGLGFAQAVGGAGLAVVAAAAIAALADAAGVTARLALAAAGWRPAGRLLANVALGLVAGLGSTPAAALAVATPLGAGIDSGRRAALARAFTVSAAHGALFPSPVIIAAASILAADLWTVAGLAVPVVAVAILVGVLVAASCGRGAPAGPPTALEAFAPTIAAAAAPVPAAAVLLPAVPPRGGGAALVATTLLLLVLLAVQSSGDLPSEPFGGGPIREMILGVGRPFVLVLAGVALMLAGTRLLGRAVVADDGVLGRAVARAAPLVLAVGAAGGLQMILQRTGVAELAAERFTILAPPAGLALVVPFVIAAAVKTLQGSSLVAAITAAGMMVPLLAPLGLDGDAGRALAVLAVGAGAMTVAHVNDGFFWLAASTARERPWAGFLSVSLGTLAQGLAALAALLALAAMLG